MGQELGLITWRPAEPPTYEKALQSSTPAAALHVLPRL